MTLKSLMFLTSANVALLAMSLPIMANAQDQDDRRGKLVSLDTDGDGAISREEVTASRLEAFSAADSNGDGALSADEMTAFHEAKRAKRRVERQARKFAKIDADGDGLISAEEFSAKRDERFERVDTNGDGLLSAEEIEDARKARRGKGPRGRRDG